MVREYFKNGNTEEKALAAKCDELWKGIQWNWYTKAVKKYCTGTGHRNTNGK
jgi:hypothetical protein